MGNRVLFGLPLHSSNKFITFNHLWLYFSHVLFLFFCLHKLSLSPHTCSRTSPLYKKMDFPFSETLLFPSSLHFKSRSSPTTYEVNMRFEPISWPLCSPDSTVLNISLARICEVLCCQNICGSQWKSLCEDNRNNPKYGESNVDPHMDYRRDVTMIRTIKFSKVEGDYKTLIHCLSYGTISEILRLNLFWLSRGKNLNTRIRLCGHSVWGLGSWIFFSSCTDGSTRTYVEPLSCGSS
jgi:hypothetical protein